MYFFVIVMLMNLISDGARPMILKPKNSALARSLGSEEPVPDSQKVEGFIPNFGIYIPLSRGLKEWTGAGAASFTEGQAELVVGGAHVL